MEDVYDIGAIGFTHLRNNKRFYFDSPNMAGISIKDIARNLSRIPRFTGWTHGLFGYSVAQHSVYVSRACRWHCRLHGLLHDSSEAFMSDIPGPLKKIIGPRYEEIEGVIFDAVWAEFGHGETILFGGPVTGLLDWIEVKVNDRRILCNEQRDLFKYVARDFPHLEPLPLKIRPWPAKYAEYRFLKKYEELIKCL